MCLLFRKITDIPLIFNNIIQNQDYIRKTFMQKGQPFLTVLTDLQIHFQFYTCWSSLDWSGFSSEASATIFSAPASFSFSSATAVSGLSAASSFSRCSVSGIPSPSFFSSGSGSPFYFTEDLHKFLTCNSLLLDQESCDLIHSFSVIP